MQNSNNESTQQTQDENQDPSTQKRQWTPDHFDVIETQEGPRSEKKRRCSFEGCSQEYSYGTSHTVLQRHWRKAHGSNFSKQGKYLFDKSEFIDSVVKYIIDHQQPYSIVERKTFRSMLTKANPRVEFISGTRISQLILDGLEPMKKMIAEELDQVLRVSLTFDIWSQSAGAAGYGCLTGHYITEEFELKTLVLGFDQLSYPHDAKTISNYISEILREFKLLDKVVSITTDNASVNIKAIRELISINELDQNRPLGFVFVRCAAHILQLSANNSLKLAKPSISNIREFIKSIKSSGKRADRFYTIERAYVDSFPPHKSSPTMLKLILDVDTRWNSTFAMLERACKLESPIKQALAEIPGLKDYEDIDWACLNELVEFLKPFNELTEVLSGDKYPTLSLIVALVPKLVLFLQQAGSDSSLATELIKKLSAAALTTFKDYGTEMSQNCAILANLMDPRFKLESLPGTIKTNARNFISRLIDIDETTSIESQDNSSLFDGIFLESSVSELDHYIAAPREPKNTDVLNYWKQNSSRFPKLASFARQLLCIQATSVASERSFSIAGELNVPKRNGLSLDSFRANVLLKSWLSNQQLI